MSKPSTIIFFFLILFIITSEKTKEEWKSRSIYQLLTDRYHPGTETLPQCRDLLKYCGGTFKGITSNLNHIISMGFNAIWISPVIKNTEDSYHGYHFVSLNEINSNFGTKEDLKKLVEEAHKLDIWVMVDVVGNHVGPIGLDFKLITPFNQKEHYHENCDITDWNNQWMVENCRLSELPDLNHENSFVNNTLIKWINSLVNEYEFDGIRIDTIPEVPKWFWKKFSESAGVYQLGEVFNSNPAYVANYQDVVDGLFNYPLYYSIQNSFCDDMTNIEEYYYNARRAFKDLNVLGVFVENHDNPRFLYRCNKDKDKFKNAIVFSILWEGIPVFYYGGEYFYEGGDDPLNREILWDHMGNKSEMIDILSITNSLRKNYKIWELDLKPILAEKKLYAFKRGNILVLVTNGSEVQKEIENVGYDEGQVLVNVYDKNDTVTVKDGKLIVNLNKLPKIYIPQ